MNHKQRVRRSGANLWRPSRSGRAMYAVLASALTIATVWLAYSGELSPWDWFTFTLLDVGLLGTLPIVLFRWRMVLEPDALYLVFARVRRIPITEIVGAKCKAGEGLIFVCRDTSTESFAAFGNTAWSHRRRHPTRADLAARTILSAAAKARGEEPPTDYRLPPVSGLGRAVARGTVIGFIISCFTS